jgi:starch synthase
VANEGAEQQMKILFVAAEVAPFTKVGGLADVAGSLPVALAELGHDVRVVMPRYAAVSPEKWNLKTVIEHFEVPLGSGSTGVGIMEGVLPGFPGAPAVPIYFVQNQHHFERPKIYGYDDDPDRFIVFCQAVLQMLPRLNWRPDVIHANDWHTGLVPNYLKTLYYFDSFLGGIRAAFTIHNLAYQGIFGTDFLRQANLQQFGIVWGDRDGAVNMLGRGIAYSDAVSTVSPTYVSEIMTPEYGEGLDWLVKSRFGHIWGILNGIDYHFFNPATDKQIVANYSAENPENKAVNKAELQKAANLPVDPNVPLIGMVSRLADQKGFDLLAMSADSLLQRNLQLVILGTGEYHYHEFLYWLSQRYPTKVGVMLAFDAALAQKIYAGSDMFLMPSRFEPGGLGQLIAMRYGTIPVVRHTGGLADTVKEYNPFNHTGNGFLFGPYEPVHLENAVDRASITFLNKADWQKLIRVNMLRDSSWESSARQYQAFYHQELGLV